ncbi:unnamed protein product [Pseudo-nitzschia multistriata]|uniref:Uncharacterized protein n=1 Tax=Pseudo-nitzschia multistriata TaxID=183589 RepID=A0A448YYY4_9STRA|nr:unnamed protein product [Pseudo-nitzschia multistriata]
MISIISLTRISASFHRLMGLLVVGSFESVGNCMLPESSTMNSRLWYSESSISLLVSPMGISYLAKMAPSSSIISSGAIPASAAISGSWSISIVALVDSARGISCFRSSFMVMWSSMEDTMGRAWALFTTVVAGAGDPAAAFWASFHLLYSGFSFMIPLILVYFFGGMVFVGCC